MGDHWSPLWFPVVSYFPPNTAVGLYLLSEESPGFPQSSTPTLLSVNTCEGNSYFKEQVHEKSILQLISQLTESLIHFSVSDSFRVAKIKHIKSMIIKTKVFSLSTEHLLPSSCLDLLLSHSQHVVLRIPAEEDTTDTETSHEPGTDPACDNIEHYI